jgi:hypothetical protein
MGMYGRGREVLVSKYSNTGGRGIGWVGGGGGQYPRDQVKVGGA